MTERELLEKIEQQSTRILELEKSQMTYEAREVQKEKHIGIFLSIFSLMFGGLIYTFTESQVKQEVTKTINRIADEKLKAYPIANTLGQSLAYNIELTIEQKNAIKDIASSLDKENPNNISASQWYIDVLYQKNIKQNNTEALKSIEQALKQAPFNAQYHNYKSMILQALGEKTQALKAAKLAIEQNPTYAAAWNQKGIMLARLGDNKGAIEAYEMAINYKTNDISTYLFNQGISLKNNYQHCRALKKLQKANRLFPKKPEILTEQGLILNEIGLNEIECEPEVEEPIEMAIESFEQALNIERNNSKALIGKAKALRNQKQYKDAIYLLEKANEIDPKNKQTLTELGQILELQGDELINSDHKQGEKHYNNAIDYFDQALEINNEYVTAIKSKASILKKKKQYEDAYKQLLKADQLAPNDKFLLIELGQIQNSRANEANNNTAASNLYNSTINHFSKVLDMYPKNILALNGIGLAHHHLGEYKEALKSHKKAYTLDKQNYFTLYNLVDNYKEIAYQKKKDKKDNSQECAEAKKYVKSLCKFAPSRTSNEARILIHNLGFVCISEKSKEFKKLKELNKEADKDCKVD